MPPEAGDRQLEWHRATGEARDALAYALELAAVETLHHGRPTQDTFAAVQICHDLVEVADAAARGLESAPPLFHPRLHVATDGLAPWVSGPWRDAGPEDVAIVDLLGLEASWDPAVGLCASTGGLDAVWRWGYLTALLPDGRTQITRAPEIARSPGEAQGASRGSATPAAVRGQNPYTKERPARRNRHGVPLDASLRTLILPVQLTLPSKQSAREWHRGDSHELFAPGQWAVLRAEQPPFGTSELQADSMAQASDIGFGSPELLVTRTIPIGGPDVRFGASEATLDDCSQDELGHRLWTVEPSVCLSLWQIDRSAVVTVERITPTEELDLLTTQDRPDPQDERVLAAVDADILNVLPALLKDTGLDANLSIAEAFPDEAAALARWLGEPGSMTRSLLGRLPSFGTNRRPTGSRSRIRDLRVATAERIRGRATTEGLYVVTSPRLSQRVESLLSRAAQPQRAMAMGAPRSWTRLELVDQPAEKAALSAVREDLRAAALNLEAMSLHHEYRRFGGGMVMLTIPFVAHRAAMARDQRSLEEAATSDDADSSGDLAVLAQVQRSALRRRVARRLVGPERFRTWTVPAQLVSELFRMTQEQLRELDGEVEELAGLVHAGLQRAQQQRRDKYDRVVSWVAPVAGFSVLVSMYAALASLPSRTHDQLLAAVPEALLATGSIVAVGLIIGAAWDRAVRGKRRSRSAGD